MKSACFNLTSFNRCAGLELFKQKKSIIFYSITLIILLSIGNLGSISYTSFLNTTGFTFYLYVIGIFMASCCFSIIHHPRKNQDFFMLPASIMEKMLSRALLSSIGFALGYLALYSLFHFLASAIYHLNNPDMQLKLVLFQKEAWLTILKFLIFHSFFMLGSCYFKRFSFIKTAIILAIGFSAKNFMVDQGYFGMLNHHLDTIMLVLMVLMMIISYVCCYFRLKEHEASA